MISKVKIGIILASAMVTTAAVYAGVAHHHRVTAAIATAAANQHVEQIPITPKPAAGKPLDAAPDAGQNSANDPSSPEQQSNDSADDQNAQNDANQANADDSNQAPAPVAPPVRIRPAVRAKVVRVARPEAAAATEVVNPPVASMAPALSVAPPLPAAIVVPSGTELILRIDEPLGSMISQVGQTFSATLDHNVEVHGHVAIPEGAHLTGKVIFARPAGRISGEATLQLAVTSVKFNHHEVELQTAVHNFGPTGKSKFGRFIKGIGKRLQGNENEIELEKDTAYSFNLSRSLQVQ